MGREVGGIYRIGCRISSGSFGDVFIGTNTQSGEEVAVKLEPVKCKSPQLLYEALGAGGQLREPCCRSMGRGACSGSRLRT